jgi:hypothetical protein
LTDNLFGCLDPAILQGSRVKKQISNRSENNRELRYLLSKPLFFDRSDERANLRRMVPKGIHDTTG